MVQTQENSTSSPEKYVHHIIDLAKTQVRDTAEYRELTGRGISHPVAFKQVAERVGSDRKNGLSEADRSLLFITGNLGVFVEAQQEIEEIKNQSEGRLLDEDEKWTTRNLKNEYVIPFNHHLKEFVNTHPNDEIRTVSSALTNAYGTIFSRYSSIDSKKRIYDTSPNPQEVMTRIQAVLDGIRHEVAAESLIEASGYSYDYKTSTQEDAAGSDLFIYLDSGWEGIDVKASPSAVGYSQKAHRYSKAVWTGLDWGDFTGIKGTGHGTLSIPYSVAEAKCDTFIANIHQMVEANRAKQNSFIQQAAGRVLKS